MPPILLGEYRNQHARRYYPFEDSASLQDDNNIALPIDFLLDAELYPIDLVNGLYVSIISVDDRTITISDTADGTVHGIATYAIGDEIAIVREPVYNRQVGVLVFGDGLSELSAGGSIRTFSPEATSIVPTAFIQLNQNGVRGVVLDDGTLITGDVVFEGRDGITVTSVIDDDGINRLKFDIVGANVTSEDDCTDEICPLIKTIRVNRQPGSVFTVMAIDSCTLAIYGNSVTLDQLCELKRSATLPDTEGNLPLKPKSDGSDEPCDPDPVVPPIPPTDDSIELDFDVTACDGNFALVAPSTAEARNLFNVMPYNQVNMPGAQRFRQTGSVQDAADLEDQVAQFRDPAWHAEGVVIGMRGLPKSRRGI